MGIGNIETFGASGHWYIRVTGGDALPATYDRFVDAVEIGNAMAAALGVEHVVVHPEAV